MPGMNDVIRELEDVITEHIKKGETYVRQTGLELEKNIAKITKLTSENGELTQNIQKYLDEIGEITTRLKKYDTDKFKQQNEKLDQIIGRFRARSQLRPAEISTNVEPDQVPAQAGISSNVEPAQVPAQDEFEEPENSEPPTQAERDERAVQGHLDRNRGDFQDVSGRTQEEKDAIKREKLRRVAETRKLHKGRDGGGKRTRRRRHSFRRK
jgi:hypothetical protein